MLEKLKEKFAKNYGKGIYVELNVNKVRLKSSRLKDAKTLSESDLPNYKADEEIYLRSLASFLREELAWVENYKELGISFLLEEDLLKLEEFNLVSIPRKEEQEAVSWEVKETLNLLGGSYYYKLKKSKEKIGEEYLYTLYACEKALVHKLCGLAEGFDLKLKSIAPLKASGSPKENNLCPKELYMGRAKEKIKTYGKKFLCVALGIAALVFGSIELAIYKEEAELKSLKEEIERQRLWQEHFTYANALGNETRRLNKMIMRLDKNKKQQTKILEAVGRSLVPGVWLTGLEEEGKAYKITGRSVDLLGVKAWSEELPLNSHFKKVQVLSTDARIGSLSFSARVQEK